MKTKSLEIFIPGPAGRLEAKYYKNPKFGSPVAIVLHPHPQYGGTMNNFIVHCTTCLLYTSPSPRDLLGSRMPSSA